MHKSEQQKGNTLALTVTVFAVVLLGVTFFVLNFAQFLGFHKQAQSAVDAAALQAAQDIGRIVIEGRSGRVALVDDVPSNGDFNKRSILGINTILGTIRLDLVIAKELGNSSMVFMARQDLESAKKDADALARAIQDAINGKTALDKDGRRIDVRANVLSAYNSNCRRLGNTKPLVAAGDLKVVVGQLKPGEGETNIPTPQPASVDPVTQNPDFAVQVGSRRVYRPYIPVPTDIAGAQIPVTFAAVADEPKLVPNGSFVTLKAGAPPAVVQVAVQERVRTVASNGGVSGGTGLVKAISTAQAGGQRARTPSGGMYVSFPQGFPPNAQKVDFTSVRTIMNSSQLGANATASTPSPYAAWSSARKGTYFQAINGAVPGRGRLSNTAYLGRRNDDPSVSLAFMTWNWLRSLGLRPNVTAVKNALSVNLHEFAKTHTAGSSEVIAYKPTILPAAYATPSNSVPISGVVVDTIDRTTGKDPRECDNPDYQAVNLQQQLGFNELLDSTVMFPPTAITIGIDEDGTVKTTSNQELDVARQVKEELIVQSNHIARESHKAASEVFNQQSGQLKDLLSQMQSAKAELNSILEFVQRVESGTTTAENAESQPYQAHQIPDLKARADALKAQIDAMDVKARNLAQTCANALLVMANAGKVGQLSGEMYDHFMTLSGLGCSKVSEFDFLLAGSHFYPVTQAATVDGILNGVAPSGQMPGINPDGWLTKPDGSGKQGFVFYRHEEAPVIVRNPEEQHLMQSALAATSVPPNRNFQFYFTVKGDATNAGGDGSGEIVISNSSTSPLQGLSLLQGQLLYQNTNALIVRDKRGTLTQWQVVARNQNAFGNLDERGRPTAYFNDSAAPGSIGRPEIKCVVQWMIRCPVVVCRHGLVDMWSQSGWHSGYWDAANYGALVSDPWAMFNIPRVDELDAQSWVKEGCPTVRVYHL